MPSARDGVNVLGHQVVPTRLGEVERALHSVTAKSGGLRPAKDFSGQTGHHRFCRESLFAGADARHRYGD